MSNWAEPLRGVHGDVDADGQIVDSAARLARLRASIGDFRAQGVDVESQLALTLLALAGGLARAAS